METDELGLALAMDSSLPSHDVLRGLFAALGDYVIVTGLDSRVRAVNRPLPPYTTAEMLGKNVAELLAPEQPHLLESVLGQVATSAEARELELGQEGIVAGEPWRLRVGPVRSASGVVGHVIVTTDPASRQDVEAALRESQNKLRIALTASQVGLWSWDSTDDVVHWDSATQRIFGTDRAASTYQDYAALVHPDDRKLVARHVSRALEQGEYKELEHRIVRPNGEERWVLARAEVLKDASGKFRRLIGGILDVSDRRLMEDKLRQAQKMEALGELTAGLAHNFNNALMAILPNLEQAAKGVSPQVAPLLEVARQAADRAARLVGELMVFAGGGRTSERRDDNLGSVVTRAVEICRSTFSRQILLELEIDQTSPILAIDAAQVEQAVMNVCINARDALEGITGRTPTLRVEVIRVPGGAEELSGPALKPERDHARISVTDNGVGMPAAVRRRIFEPFFTTKEVGRGTGLGLSTTYAIVREHGGFVSCESEPGRGTTFRLYLPVERSGRRKDSGALALPAPGGSELLLLIDDDPVVRGVTARVLLAAGYRIIEASDGTEGLSLYEQQSARISLVLLDESMPGIAGHEVLARMLVFDPSARVAMFTGVQPGAEQLRGSRGVIRKPIGANDLLWRVRELLETP